MDKGVYRNKEHGRQAILFDGLRFGTITPTDIDAVIEVRDKAWIIIETKYGDPTVQRGQELALERMCDDLSGKKHAIILLTSHKVAVPNDICLKKTTVIRYFYKGKWTQAVNTVSCYDAIVQFLSCVAPELVSALPNREVTINECEDPINLM